MPMCARREMSETTIDYHAAGSHFEPERLPLGTLLIEDGLINEAQLASALAESTQTGERIGETVVRHGWATEDDIARLLAEQVRLDYLQRASIFFDGEALGRLTREDAQRLEALPTRVRDGRVVVAVSDPTTERLAAVRDQMGQDMGPEFDDMIGRMEAGEMPDDGGMDDGIDDDF